MPAKLWNKIGKRSARWIRPSAQFTLGVLSFFFMCVRISVFSIVLRYSLRHKCRLSPTRTSMLEAFLWPIVFSKMVPNASRLAAVVTFEMIFGGAEYLDFLWKDDNTIIFSLWTWDTWNFIRVNMLFFPAWWVYFLDFRLIINILWGEYSHLAVSLTYYNKLSLYFLRKIMGFK